MAKVSSEGRIFYGYGKCKKHKPCLKPVGERWFEASEGIFGIKRWWLYWCCGKPLLKGAVYQNKKCTECSRVETFVVYPRMGCCSICDSISDFSPRDPFGG